MPPNDAPEKGKTKEAKGLKRADPALPDWDFVQWTGAGGEQDVVDFLAPTVPDVAGYISLDGATLLLLARSTGGPRTFSLAYADAGGWVAVNPEPTSRDDWLVVVPDGGGTPSGFVTGG